MSRTSLSTLLLSALLTSAGCNWRTAKPVVPDDPNDWQRTESVDPAGDLAAIRGRWHFVDTHPDPHFRSEQYLVIGESTVTFDYVSIRKSKQKLDLDEYTFVVNSARTPKVICFVQRLQGGPIFLSHNAPWSYWYSLEGDTLTLWDKWAALGETEKSSYQRVAPAP